MKINLNELEIYSAAEASEMLGKSSNYIRQMFAKYPDKFPEGSIRKIGRDLIVTKEAMLSVSPYYAIELYLKECNQNMITLSFEEINSLFIEHKLPRSAYKHNAWWSNATTSHPHSQSWQNAGYKTTNIDLVNETITFVK